MASAILLLLLISLAVQINGQGSMIEEATVATTYFTFEEATVADAQQAFRENRLTSRQLVNYYLDRIRTLNSTLRSVIEVNPDALNQAHRADLERAQNNRNRSILHGIPVLLKDNISTKDKLNTTAGSYALLGSVVPRDAGVVVRLRAAGAVILGKASMSQWAGFRSVTMPEGWCSRAGRGVNPYVRNHNPCGSSSGSSISAAANMAMVTLGTETDWSLVCPAEFSSVVGIKPTVGLTSRAGVIPVSHRQDTIGPICRTVADAVHVLNSIVGHDARDDEATRAAAGFIPPNGYTQFLNKDGLRRKRLGVVRNPFTSSASKSTIRTFNGHLRKMRKKGAVVIDNLEIPNISEILNSVQSGEITALLAEFKLSLNEYLKKLTNTTVKSLSDVIEFNARNPHLENTTEIGQGFLIDSNSTNGIGANETRAIENMRNLTRNGFEKIMQDNNLDAMVTLGYRAATVVAIGGCPAITVPAGYDSTGMPFGIHFGGLRGSEPKLIEIAYGFEQATLVRKPPSLKSFGLSATL